MTARADRFDPADPEVWISRGRLPEHAALIAAAWRDFPDPPPGASLEERQARSRARVAAMRPVNDAIAAATERERQRGNFAFTERRLAKGEGDDRDIAILRARDTHGLDWDEAVQFATAWYAAHAGWEPRPFVSGTPARAAALRAAYDLGFREGGGDPADLFDTARRALRAAERLSNQPPPPASPVIARPLPSAWPRPTDAPRPAPWQRRLIIVEGRDMQPADPDSPALAHFRGHAFDQLRGCPGAAGATIVILTAAHGFVLATEHIEAHPMEMTAVRARALASDEAQRSRLRRFTAACEPEDILVVAQDSYLDIIDAHAAALPLCRRMERTRNTPLQQKAHLRLWLARGLRAGEVTGSGHIRWGKRAKGLTGRLGEFTARDAGRAAEGGHAIRIETGAGDLATGFVTAGGIMLEPVIRFSNRRHLRATMERALRAFAASTRLTAGARLDNRPPAPICDARRSSLLPGMEPAGRATC
ncbi:hypothetical protein [Sphingomonas oryzagri]